MFFKFAGIKGVESAGALRAETHLPSGFEMLTSGLSIEASPKEALRGAEGLERLPTGTRVFITRLPKGNFEETLAAAIALKGRGLSPVPHVTARTVPDAGTLERWLHQMVDEAKIEEILLIAGANDKPEGRFSDTLAILNSGVIENSGLKGINVAGHPEGHPQADERTLRHAIDLKNEFAARTGLPVTLVTQFFFDAAPVIAWERRLRAEGNRLNIDPGLHGVTSVTSLLKHALACGVGASVKALTAHSASLTQFAQARTPDVLADELAQAKAEDPGCLFRNFHMFPLGGMSRTTGWILDIKQGRYGRKKDGRLVVGA